jgi:type III secretion protein N (ATPase)
MSQAERIAEALRSVGSALPEPPRRGRVVRAVGTLVDVAGLDAQIGDGCEFHQPGEPWRLLGEVVGVHDDRVSVLPLGRLTGLSARTQVRLLGRQTTVQVGDGLLGAVLDGYGVPMAPIRAASELTSRPVRAEPPSPLERRPVDRPFSTGVRAIDGLIACGVGQRVGVFAPAGAGKSTLLSMIALGAVGNQTDVVVLALVGERGREVREFLEDLRQLGLSQRTAVVVATSDRPAAERAKAPEVAMAVAEHFRDQGRSVLLLMDSVTRYARALREIGLAAGEPPGRRGYPPSVFALLPQLFERAGPSRQGDITAFFTVLVDDDAAGDPVYEEVRATLDGHIVLSPKLADGGHYPAIDVLASRSRVMQRVASATHLHSARRFRQWLQKLQDIETLVQIGEYRHGADALADEAISKQADLRAFLVQERDRSWPSQETMGSMLALTSVGAA